MRPTHKISISSCFQYPKSGVFETISKNAFFWPFFQFLPSNLTENIKILFLLPYQQFLSRYVLFNFSGLILCHPLPNRAHFGIGLSSQLYFFSKILDPDFWPFASRNLWVTLYRKGDRRINEPRTTNHEPFNQRTKPFL